MDPDKTLAFLRSQCAVILRDDSRATDAEYSLAEDIDNLDKWLSAGGFLPKAWERRENGV
jgi:hypothetical protein